ncbi:hypothetical protein C2S52_014363 [Perilla frutescens var. hirtella]|nr:hypothetical protein C2S52_014363 [Perilla frutescens var. hirtella]
MYNCNLAPTKKRYSLRGRGGDVAVCGRGGKRNSGGADCGDLPHSVDCRVYKRELRTGFLDHSCGVA